MKYPYIVGKNGVWYPAWADVPEDNQNTKEQNEQNKHTKTENGQNQYTKTEINRMSTAELQVLAIENGINGAEGMTGADLKKVLIEHFKL